MESKGRSLRAEFDRKSKEIVSRASKALAKAMQQLEEKSTKLESVVKQRLVQSRLNGVLGRQKLEKRNDEYKNQLENLRTIHVTKKDIERRKRKIEKWRTQNKAKVEIYK